IRASRLPFLSGLAGWLRRHLVRCRQQAECWLLESCFNLAAVPNQPDQQSKASNTFDNARGNPCFGTSWPLCCMPAPWFVFLNLFHQPLTTHQAFRAVITFSTFSSLPDLKSWNLHSHCLDLRGLLFLHRRR